MKNFDTLSDLAAFVGQGELVSDWVLITQAQVDLFAQATGDHQWIHVDPERAAKGPFGSTIAHGFLTLSLLPQLLSSIYSVKSTRMAVNYGLNKVRFTSPVPVNSKVRARMQLAQAEGLPQQGLQLLWHVTMEREGADKPVCVIESLTRLYE